MNQAQKIADSLSGLNEPIIDSDPNHCPSGYEMHFYCKYKAGREHNYNNSTPFIPEQVESQSAAIRQAVELGWSYNRETRLAVCPSCNNYFKLKKELRKAILEKKDGM